MLYDVTFVLTSIVHKHVKAQSEQELRDHLIKEYGLGEEFYGPATKNLTDTMSRAIENGEFYITSFVRGFYPENSDEIAGEQKSESGQQFAVACKNGEKNECNNG